MTSQELFDRFQAIQHYSEWTIEATAQDDNVIDGLILNGFITSAGIHELENEFNNVYLREDGLILH